MFDSPPPPNEAKGAWAEAGPKAAQVRRSDRQFRWILLLLVAIYLVVAGIVSATSRPGPSFGWLVVLVLLGGGLVGIGLLVLWIRAYSKAGILWFTGGATAFNWGNAVVRR